MTQLIASYELAIGETILCTLPFRWNAGIIFDVHSIPAFLMG